MFKGTNLQLEISYSQHHNYSQQYYKFSELPRDWTLIVLPTPKTNDIYVTVIEVLAIAVVAIIV